MSLSTYTVDGIPLTGNPTSLVSGTNTLRPGSPPVTISHHTLSIPASATRGQISVDGTLTNLPTKSPASSPTSSTSSTSHVATSAIEILGVTSTDTVPPADLSTQLVTSTWTSNTWLTTTKGGKETTVPVLVGCAHCGGTGGGVIVWNFPPLPGVSFQFPKLPNGDIVDPFHLPCVSIPSLKSCASSPVDDPPVDGAAGGDEPDPDDPSSSLNSKTPSSSAVSWTSSKPFWSSTLTSAMSSTTSRQISSGLCSACANNDPPSSYPRPSKFRKRALPHHEKTLSTDVKNLTLMKRVFPSPSDPPWDGNLISFLYDQIAVAEDEGNEIALRIQGIDGVSSALAIELQASPVSMAVQGMYGCTSVIVISRRLGWGSHLWEGEGFKSGEANFKATILDVLGPGDGTPEMPGLSQFTGSGGRLAPTTKPQVFIITPGFVSGSGNMFYPQEIAAITTRLKQILGQDVPVKPILYDPVDGPSEPDSGDGSDNDDEWTPSGRFLFQYDPDGTRCNGVQTAMWRLWIEDDPREQGSWPALTDQLVPRRKRQEIATGTVAVCSALSSQHHNVFTR